jgi:hypothetical protein
VSQGIQLILLVQKDEEYFCYHVTLIFVVSKTFYNPALLFLLSMFQHDGSQITDFNKNFQVKCQLLVSHSIDWGEQVFPL